MKSKRKHKPSRTNAGAKLKQAAFVEFYLQSWNAADAARRAGYSPKTAYAIGYELLRKPEVQKAIEVRLEHLKMTSDEVLVRLAAQARGSIESFLSSGNHLDLQVARENGALHLARKVKNTKRKLGGEDGVEIESLEVEMYSSQEALVHIGRALKMFGDRNEEFDPTQLSTGQLERLAKGESLYSVLANPGESGVGVAPAAGDDERPAD